MSDVSCSSCHEVMDQSDSCKHECKFSPIDQARMEGRKEREAEILAWLRSLPRDEWYPQGIAERIEEGV